MYLSRLYIKNYRSIKEIDLKFKKGKNVIVGKNNAGKSNIIKALDLVLGESSPTYNKSSNVSKSDFFRGNISEPIYIFCELSISDSEIFNFSNIKNRAIYSIKKDGNDLTVKIEDLTNYHDFSELFLFEDEEGQVLLDDKSSGYSKKWIGGKPYCGANTFDKEFGNAKKIIFGFLVEEQDGVLNKKLNLLYSDDGEEYKFGCNCGALRNIFLQSAIIPSFRDTKDQLRITNYSWYGKLLKNYVDSDDEDLLRALDDVKEKGQKVFSELQSKLGDKKINIAFPNTNISFQFNPEQQEIYKNTQIYVDDGFNSPLQDKGSGIQSAVVIGLFDFYVRNILQSGNSLLAIEEPELYLHPHGRRVISDRLNDFLDGGKNQVIIATHSSEFIVPMGDDLNIIVLRKNGNKGTKGKNIDFSGVGNIKRKQILIKKEVAEMFFADYVILTEDCKHYIEETAKILGKEKDDLGEHWLNNNNISVLNTGGKTWFHEYRKLLDYAGIPNYILADFNYIRDGGLNNNLENSLKQELDTLKSKLKTSYPQLDIDFEALKKLFSEGEYIDLKKAFNNSNKEISKRLKNGNYKKLNDIDPKYHGEINGIRKKLENVGIFLLNGELEDSYLVGSEPKKKKEGGVIETICKMMEDGKDISDFIDTSEIKDFLLHIAKKEKFINTSTSESQNSEEENIEKSNDKKIEEKIDEKIQKKSTEDAPF